MSKSLSVDYQHGYAAGLRDATAWALRALGAAQAAAHHLSRSARQTAQDCERFEGAAGSAIDLLQGRWAALDDTSGENLPGDLIARFASLDEPRSKPKRKRQSKAAEPVGPTLCLDASTIAPAPEPDLTEEQQMKRAAGRAWRS